MNVAEKKAFDAFRRLGIFALFCTLLLWAGLWAYSGMTSNSGLNNSISGSINDAFDMDNQIAGTQDAQYIRFSQFPSSQFKDTTGQLTAVVYPSNASDTEFEYSSSNPTAIEIDETGKVTFKQIGSTYLTATLKNHPEISFSQISYCLGINPSKNNKPNTFGTDEANNSQTIKQYETVQVPINGGYTDRHSVAKYISSDESIATVDHSGRVKGISIGDVTITAQFSDGYELECAVHIVNNPDFVPATSITLIDDFNLRVTKTYNTISNFIKSTEPLNANRGDIHVKSSNTSIAREDDAQLLVYGCGEVTLTFYSEYDPSVYAEKTVYIPQITPTDVHVSAPTVLVPHKEYHLESSLTPVYHSGSVTWEVIEGQATINENGVLVPTFWGKVVVRCSSTLDPTVYTDVTMMCKLYDNTYYLVRKLMGHFSLSALLGFGIFCTMFLFEKRKWKAFVATPILSFIYSGISEVIQYFTPGRYCTWTDVLTDYAGTLLGMILGMVLYALIAIIWLIEERDTFGAFKYTMKHLTIHNAWRKTYVADEYVREEPSDILFILNRHKAS